MYISQLKWYTFCLHFYLINIHIFDYPDSRLSGLFTVVPTSLDNRGSAVQTNRPCSIYQYSSMVLRLAGQNCKFFMFLLSLNFQKRLGYKENNTKYRSLTWKPRSHVRILIYRTWPINLPKATTRKLIFETKFKVKNFFSCSEMPVTIVTGHKY